MKNGTTGMRTGPAPMPPPGCCSLRMSWRSRGPTSVPPGPAAEVLVGDGDGRGAVRRRAAVGCRGRVRRRSDAGGRAGRRGGLEAHPADALEVDLRPGVRVVGAHDVAAVLLLLARREADGDAGRDAERAGHHGHRRGELHAVAALALQERDDRLGAVLVAGGVGRQVLGVDEVRPAQPVLQRHRPRVVGGGLRVADDLAGLQRDARVEVLRQLEVAPQRRRDRRRRRGAAGHSSG